MEKKSRCYCSAACLVALCLGHPSVAKADLAEESGWKDRFLKEAPKGWAAYSSKAARLQGTIWVKSVLLRDRKHVLDESTVEIKQAPGCALVLNQSIVSANKPDPSGRLAAVNRHYRFELTRKSASDPWVLAVVSRELAPPRLPNRPDTSAPGLVHAWVAGPITLPGFGNDWPSLVASPDFQLKKVAPIEEDGTALVQVEFEMGWAASKDHLRRVKGGRVSFDPEHCWVMRAFDVQLDSWSSKKKVPASWSVSASLEYADGGHGFPILKRWHQRREVLGETSGEETDQEFNLTLEDIPESEFTLAAFGFPEPAGLARRQVPWFWWAASLGVVCIGLALLLRRWGQRRARRVETAR